MAKANKNKKEMSADKAVLMTIIAFEAKRLEPRLYKIFRKSKSKSVARKHAKKGVKSFMNSFCLPR